VDLSGPLLGPPASAGCFAPRATHHVMSDTVMNLYFCDLCNESIPQADLDLGRAVRRNERLICAACEAAMSGSHARPAPTTPAPLAAPHIPQPVRESSSGSSIAAVALAFSSVALVAGIGAATYLFWRLEDGFVATRQRLADLERSAPEPARTVAAALAEESRTRESEAAETRASIQALSAHLAELEQGNAQVSALERRVEKLDERFGAVDDLASRVQHQAGVIDQLNETVAAISVARPTEPREEAPARRPEVAEKQPPPAPEASRPAWERWVPDLSSPDSGTRWQAVQGLGGSHDVAVVPHLVPMLADTDIFVRMAACRHLGDLGSVEAIPKLIDALEDEEASVREAALVALRSLSGQSIPFDPLARESDRSRRVKDWRDWWESASNKSKSRN